MTERMTSSEIADWLADRSNSKCANVSRIMLAEAADTIRELEAHLKTEERGHTETLEALGEKAKALKIATEALYTILTEDMTEHELRRFGSGALARIKEVG